MPKNLLGKYYHEKKRKTIKKVREKYQNLSKEEKETKQHMIVNVTNISQNMKKRNWLSIERNIMEREKTFL